MVDVLLIGLLLFGSIAVVGLALINWIVGFLGGLFVVWAGSVLVGLATRRYGAKALAGDAVAQAKIDGWKRWQKKWTR